jgi:hypothetical protein
VGWHQWITGGLASMDHRWIGISGSPVGWHQWITGVVALKDHYLNKQE